MHFGSIHFHLLFFFKDNVVALGLCSMRMHGVEKKYLIYGKMSHDEKLLGHRTVLMMNLFVFTFLIFRLFKTQNKLEQLKTTYVSWTFMNLWSSKKTTEIWIIFNGNDCWFWLFLSPLKMILYSLGSHEKSELLKGLMFLQQQ